MTQASECITQHLQRKPESDTSGFFTPRRGAPLTNVEATTLWGVPEGNEPPMTEGMEERREREIDVVMTVI